MPEYNDPNSNNLSQLGGALQGNSSALGSNPVTAPYAAAAGIIGSTIGNWGSMLSQGQNAINPNAAPQQFDMNGDPSYNQGSLAANTLIKPKGAQFGDYLNGALLGVPGLVVTAIIGGKKKREMQRKHDLAVMNLNNANNMYSQAKTQYYNRQGGMIDYNNKVNPYDRLTALYQTMGGTQ